jgi:uncharacterized protein (TIRG00374 family)
LWIVTITGAGVIAVECVLLGRQFASVGSALARARWIWIAVAVTAALTSMHCMGRQQRRLLLAAMADAQLRPAARPIVIQAYIANAINVLLPGGSAASVAFSVQRMRRRGASGPQAGFALVASGVLSWLTFGCLALACALTSAPTVLVSVAVGALTAGGLAWLIYARSRRRPLLAVTGDDRSEGAAAPRVGTVLGLVGRISPRLARAVEAPLVELSRARPRKRDWFVASAWAAGNWVADLVCLIAACQAVGVHASAFAASILAAYVAGMTAAGVTFLPGGAGVVEVAMIATLRGAGLLFSMAAAAVLLYRAISCALVVMIGLTAWLVTARTRARNLQRPDAALTDPPPGPVGAEAAHAGEAA